MGIAYWGLDLKPAPNWYQNLQWPEKLLNKDEEVQEGMSSGTEACTIDIGLPEYAGKPAHETATGPKAACDPDAPKNGGE